MAEVLWQRASRKLLRGIVKRVLSWHLVPDSGVHITSRLVIYTITAYIRVWKHVHTCMQSGVESYPTGKLVAKKGKHRTGNSSLQSYMQALGPSPFKQANETVTCVSECSIAVPLCIPQSASVPEPRSTCGAQESEAAKLGRGGDEGAVEAVGDAVRQPRARQLLEAARVQDEQEAAAVRVRHERQHRSVVLVLRTRMHTASGYSGPFRTHALPRNATMPLHAESQLPASCMRRYERPTMPCMQQASLQHSKGC